MTKRHYNPENPAIFNIAAIAQFQSGALTVNEWRFYSSRRSWRGNAKRHAMATGSAVVLRANGALLLYMNLRGKIAQATYPANVWRNAS